MNIIGKKVKHKIFGEGAIIEQGDQRISVRFDDKVSKFSFPDAFNAFLTTEDKELQSEVEAKFEEKRFEEAAKKAAAIAKAAEEDAKAKAAARVMGARKVPAVVPINHPEVLDADEPVAFERMYELLNACFGTQYAGWQKCTWHPDDKSYEVWMPKLAETEEGKLRPAAFGCLNTLSPDGDTLVFEDYKEEKYNGEQPEYDKKEDVPELIFAKDPDNGSYIFRGVFLQDRTQSTYLYHVYKRIARKVNLVGFPVEKISF